MYNIYTKTREGGGMAVIESANWIERFTIFASTSCGVLTDLFSKLRIAIKKAFTILSTIRPLTKVNMV